MFERQRFEIVIVGGGIAGLSLAWALSARGVSDILVLEREGQHAVHATGRSAASLVEHDANPVLAALKVGGGRFLRAPPAGFAGSPLLVPRGIFFLHDEPEPPALPLPGVRAEVLDAAQAARRVTGLDPGAFACALHLPEDGHIDVHGLLSGYLAAARSAGVTVRCGVEVAHVLVEGGGVVGLVTEDGLKIEARWVVDAAGAWAGPVAELAGAAPIPICPLRRSIAIFAAPDPAAAASWPLVIAESRSLYFGPESGGLLLSPMDETPSPPCDARPDDVTIAGALERLGALAPELVPRSVRRRWAGLRSFAPDRVLVVGEDPIVRGFFWLAGQGGCGIETSPFVADIAADLLLDGATERFDAALLSPARFARTS